MGWKKNEPCFFKVDLKKEIPKKYLNTSAKKIKNKKKMKFFKKYINNKEIQELDNNLIAGIITPDKDIIPGSKNLSPAYVVFNNYELILMKRLRFEGFFSPDFYHREAEINPILKKWNTEGLLDLPIETTDGLENLVSA